MLPSPQWQMHIFQDCLVRVTNCIIGIIVEMSGSHHSFKENACSAQTEELWLVKPGEPHGLVDCAGPASTCCDRSSAAVVHGTALFLQLLKSL